MAQDYAFQESEAPGRFEKLLRIFVVILAFFLCAELIWLVVITPLRPFSRIDISALDGMTREEILNQAGITSGLSYFSADTAAMEEALMGISLVESARVFKFFPGRLHIILEERRAVASALSVSGEKTVPLLFDNQGVVFKIGRDAGEFSSMLPLISGIVIENPFPGMRLPALFVPLFNELEKIAASAPELLEAVSELRINPKPFDAYDITLYLVHRKIKIHLLGLNEESLRYALLTADVLASKDDAGDTLDLRSPIASYIPKEAPPEQ